MFESAEIGARVSKRDDRVGCNEAVNVLHEWMAARRLRRARAPALVARPG